MGINIQYGYKINISNLQDLNYFINDLRLRMNTPSRDLVHNRLSRTCEQILDLYHLFPGNQFHSEMTQLQILNPYDSPYLNSYRDFIGGLRKSRTVKDNSNYNFDANLLIAVVEADYCLGILYTSQPIYSEIILEMKEVEEFSYLDDSEQSQVKENTEEDYLKRKDIWKEVFGDEPASMKTFSATLTVVDNIKPDPGSVQARIRSREIRSKLLAKTIALTDYYKSCKKNNTDREKLQSFIQYANTDDGREEVKMKKLQIESIIPEFYTVQDLINPLEKKTKLKKKIKK